MIFVEDVKKGQRSIPRGIRIYAPASIIKKIHDLSLSQLNELAGFGKAYLSQVKSEKKTDLPRLLKAVSIPMSARQSQTISIAYS